MNIYINYSGDDGKKLATRLAELLQREDNISVWAFHDEPYIVGEMSWTDVYTKIRQSDWMLLLLTETGTSDTRQLFEYDCAMRAGLRVACLSAPDAAIPEEMQSRHIGAFDPRRFDNACRDLIREILRLETVIPRRAETYRQTIFHGADTLQKLRGHLNGLDADKVAQSRAMILESYLQKTIIRQLSHVSSLSDSKVPVEGKYTWWQDEITSFQKQESFYGAVCGQIAKTIVDSEYEFLYQVLQRQSANRCALVLGNQPGKRYAQLEDLIDKLLGDHHKPNFILAPLESMADFLISFHGRISWPAGKTEQLVLEKRPPLSIFWSNGKMEANAFIIGDGNALQWSVRPDEEDGALATAVGVSPLFKDRVDFFAQTEFKLDILNPDAFQVIGIPKQAS